MFRVVKLVGEGYRLFPGLPFLIVTSRGVRGEGKSPSLSKGKETQDLENTEVFASCLRPYLATMIALY